MDTDAGKIGCGGGFLGKGSLGEFGGFVEMGEFGRGFNETTTSKALRKNKIAAIFRG